MRALESDQGFSGHTVPQRVPSFLRARKSGSAALKQPLQIIAANRDAILAQVEDHTTIAIGGFAAIWSRLCLNTKQAFFVASLAADFQSFINVHGITSLWGGGQFARAGYGTRVSELRGRGNACPAPDLGCGVSYHWRPSPEAGPIQNLPHPL